MLVEAFTHYTSGDRNFFGPPKNLYPGVCVWTPLVRTLASCLNTPSLIIRPSGQVGHRHPERRVLVAEACGALAPLVAPEMRPSLVLSMLAQLAADAEPAVRAAAAAALAALLPHLPTLDKYSTVRPRPMMTEISIGTMSAG